MENYINQLNDAQRAPVLHKDGPLIVIAGAGSGKTRVLTYRIAYLMSKGVDSFNILALTFTNKAAREMKARISAIVGSSEAKNLMMGTFHSVFAKLLRYDGDKLGFPSNFTIYDTQDSQRLIASIIKEMGLDKDIYKYKQVQNRISSYKNSLITVRAYFNDAELQEADAMAKRPRMGDIYQNYVDRCFKAGAMDFDDLLLRTNELLNRFPEVLAKYQDRFRYILVDEYQDTNHSQYLIVKALSDKFQNICVVGDDAQSIYSFRGANISNILNFQKDYDNVEMYRLEQNYRSTRNIVNAANSIIAKNKNQLEVHIVSDELMDKKANLKLKVMNFKGEILSTFNRSIELKANTSKIYFEEKLNKILSDNNKENSFVLAELSNENNTIFDESIYYFENPTKLALTTPKIDVEVVKNNKGEIIVEIKTNVLAKDVSFSTTFEGRFSNNYFDMIPSKVYRIQFHSEAAINSKEFKKKLKIISLIDSY